jgi:hypothetical protein
MPERLGTHLMPIAEEIKEIAPTLPHKERKGSGEQREAWDTELLAGQFHSGHLIPDRNLRCKAA